MYLSACWDSRYLYIWHQELLVKDIKRVSHEQTNYDTLIDIFINDMWKNYAGYTLQNYKATWTSLFTNEKAKSTFQGDFFAWIAL
jgi:hypothetical protein